MLIRTSDWGVIALFDISQRRFLKNLSVQEPPPTSIISFDVFPLQLDLKSDSKAFSCSLIHKSLPLTPFCCNHRTFEASRNAPIFIFIL